MGLDIHLNVNNHEAIAMAYIDNSDRYTLSREFCNLMCRPDVINHQPELDQIGELTNTEIALLYEMTQYPDEDELAYIMEFAENDNERERLKANLEHRKQALNGNIKAVNQLIEHLILKLENFNDLYQRLIKTNFDTLTAEYYFSDFKIDKGKGYIGNNFGQDLRNFKRFIELAIAHNSETVWFEFG